MHETVTVFVVERDPRVRRGLASLIDAAGLAVRTFPAASEFLAGFRDDEAGCLVLRMTGPHALDLHEQLVRRGAILPIIAITKRERLRDDQAIEPSEAEAERANLIECIRHAIAVDRRMRDTQRDYGAIAKLFAKLTPRECDVMRLVVEGKANKVIAADLGISQRTVEIHRGRVMTKTKARSVPDLVRLALIWSRRGNSARADSPAEGTIIYYRDGVAAQSVPPSTLTTEPVVKLEAPLAR